MIECSGFSRTSDSHLPAVDPGLVRLRRLSAELGQLAGFQQLSVLLTRPDEEVSALVLEHSTRRALPGTAKLTRNLHDARERARDAVATAIAVALDAVTMRDPSLGAYLRATVSTGTLCHYRPSAGALFAAAD